jgi:hypothetical protein
MLASAAAAALAALAVTVAAPAIGDDGPPDVDDFAACLRTHGLGDVPDGAGLKPWLGERLDRGDAEATRAADACAPPDIRKPGRVETRELGECLVRHGAQIDGSGPMAIKRWVGEHGDEPAARDAMKACHLAGPGEKPAIVCGSEDGPPPGKPATPPEEPTTSTETAPAGV